ncbi:RNA methyltransferase [Thermospira aquatica]|uniref:tRNA (cytidine/uridine-2'-O-)-methyltransferase TrmJ n=1 Tax=Thermospira aquatica TaxID=2828656 RepID=A0AAX3BFF7_9SPIR|nr:RNA methyltransferase [Thermospira aquatica]URA11092.1 RNA methyltransferase [Thermospira aquatica]
MISIVLVEPEGDMNIGMIARSMMNMDVENLVLVSPRTNHLSENARAFAVHAVPILEKASVVFSLDEALRGCDVSLAVTRRIGQWRQQDVFLPHWREVMSPYAGKKIALVFGREKSGLTNDEISRCDLVLTIPSSDVFPSLNLAQAVMTVLYEIYRTRWKSSHPSPYHTVKREEFQGMLAMIIETLETMGYFKTVPRERLEAYLRKLLYRMAPDETSAMIVKNLFRRIQGRLMALEKALERTDSSTPKDRP